MENSCRLGGNNSQAVQTLKNLQGNRSEIKQISEFSGLSNDIDVLIPNYSAEKEALVSLQKQLPRKNFPKN